MSTDAEKYLRNHYPSLYNHLTYGRNYLIPINIGPGWIPLMDKFSREIMNIVWTQADANIEIQEIGELTGILSLHMISTVHFSQIINRAIDESTRTCSLCGEPGLYDARNAKPVVRCGLHLWE